MKKYKDANGEPCKYRYYVITMNPAAKECFGGSDSLRGARIIAGRNMQYNGREWYRPYIYKAEETELRPVTYVGVPVGELGSSTRWRAPVSNARPLPDFDRD